MLTDRYAQPISTVSTVARDAYVHGVDCVLAATAGVGEHLQRALAADPGLAVAQVALARGQFLEADVPRARESAAQARELASTATARERSHVDAIALAIEGRPVEALAATRAHLAEWPRDALVLAPATGVFGLIGFSGRQEREEELYELLHGLAPFYGDDWWFGAMLAFAACESGRLDEAWRLIEASMAANPGNAHGAHVRVHVLYEQGEMAAALDYLDGWMPGFDRRGLLHCHLSWHVALCALAIGRIDRAWAAYRSGVHPGGAWGPPINVVTDAVAFLWRSELAGEPRQPGLWREVHEYTRRSFPKAGLPFIDVHAAVDGAVVGDKAAFEAWLGEVERRIDAGKYPAGDVVLSLALGFAAFAEEDWNAAIGHLVKALPQTVRIGGSRAQRDLVESTLLAAYVKAERPDDARALIEHRAGRRSAIDVAGLPT